MNRIDLTLDDMANNKFLTIYNSLIKSFTASTDFSSNDVVSLLIVFYKYTLNNGTRMMSTQQLYNLFLVSFGIFDVYTSAGTLVLNREVVGLAIEKFFYGDDDDEIKELRADMCEFLFAKFDTDKDGVIAFEEYAEIVQNQPGLLEFLGKIFPDDKDRSLVAYCHNIESMFPPEDGY
ncbi:uncharacterized protein LOC108041446 isoform X2 [Drosophila rhopaloa]|uniref:EF-hand domain-containing protein n=1 Tax=Drosophila rhopaloa TaxID=1041015 RepID=A0ABM5H5I7_DRORH|nr:uncharacterized protein LOC108041446 isoform X2 [Drosophila rhopaloa]